jgi:hypothetical protein
LAGSPPPYTDEQMAALAASFNEAGLAVIAWAERLAAAWSAALAPLAAQLAQLAEPLAAVAGGDEMRWQAGDWTGP